MDILLSKDEVLKVLFCCFANGGLTEIGQSDVIMIQDKEFNKSYKEAKEEWQKEHPGQEVCYEDVLCQMVRRGDTIRFRDHNEDKVVEITLKMAKERLQNEKAIKNVMKCLDENGDDDAWTGYELLQHVFYGEVIYG